MYFVQHFHHAFFCTDDYTSKLLSLSFSTTNSSSFTGTSSIQVTNNKTKNTSEHGHVTSSKPPPDYSNSNGKKFIEKCDFILEYAVENILPTIAGATKS